MSGLRDSLGEWAAARGDEVAAATRVNEPAARVAIGRRRTRNLAGTAGVAVVAVVAASTLAVAAPWKGEQQIPSASEAPVVDAKFSCGQPWTLEAGTTTYFPDADYYFGDVSGQWISTTDGGEVVESPQDLIMGYDSLAWQGTVETQDSAIARGLVLAVRDGVIVGSRAGGDEQGSISFNDEVTAFGPYPGACGNDIAELPDGEYTYHVVFEVEQVQDQERPVATVVDPDGALVVSTMGLPEWGEAANAAPAQPAAPEGDIYQGFIVARPLANSSCEPYTSMFAHGNPSQNALTYPVTIPGVQPLTGGLWSGDPVASVDATNLSSWFVSLPTGIISEHFGDGNPLSTLRWTTGAAVGETVPPGNLRLVHTDDDFQVADIPEDCFFVLPGATPSGAVYLVVDGVDWATVGDMYPLADFASTNGFQTWIYLGEIES